MKKDSLVFLRAGEVCLMRTLIRYFHFMGTFCFFFLYPSLLLSWIFEHDCLNTCCLGCLTWMWFVFFVFALVQCN